MADASTSIDIMLRARADVSAVDKLNASLGITNEREKELGKMREAFMTAAEAEVAKIKKLTEETLALAKAREASAKPLPKALFSDAQIAADRASLQRAANPWASTGNSSQIAMFNQYRQTLAQVAPVQDQVARSGRNNAAAMLELSRAVEDAQYGIRGILNNIPMLVQSLGMGAGMAGGISIAAVAATSLLPVLSEWLGLTQALDDALGGTSKKLREQADAAGAKLSQALGLATQHSDLFAAAQRKEEEAIKAANDELDRNVKLLDARSRIALMMEDADLAAQVEGIKASGLSAQDESAAIAQAKMQSAQRKAAQEEQARIAQMQLATGGRDAALGELTQATARRQDLQRRLIDGAIYEGAVSDAALMRDKLAELQLEKENSDRRGTYEPAREKARSEEMARLQAVIARKEQVSSGLIEKYGFAPSFQADDQKKLATAREAEKKRAEELTARQSALGTLANEQRIARELSNAQLGIQARQTAAAMPGPQAAFGLGAPLPAAQTLPGTGRAAPGTAPGGLPPALGQLPVQIEQLNKIFADMSAGIERLNQTATKTAEKLKNSR